MVAVAAGGLLLIAWIAWAVYVTSDNGAEAGLGVVIAWLAMLAALALISLPFIGVYLLMRRMRSDEGTDAAAEPDAEEIADGEPEAEDEENPEIEESADEEEADGEEDADDTESDPPADEEPDPAEDGSAEAPESDEATFKG